MIMVDPPQVPMRGRMWSHVASDTSYEELHEFARAVGIPERGFDRDHYDVPDEWYDRMAEAAANTSQSPCWRATAAKARALS